MTYQAERQSIESRFATLWTDPYPVKYDNIDFIIPDGIYLELMIQNAPALIMSTAGTSIMERTPGIISVNLFVPVDTGTATARTLVDKIAAIFRFASFDAIQCRAPAVRRLGEIEKRFVYNISTPFHRDEYF